MIRYETTLLQKDYSGVVTLSFFFFLLPAISICNILAFMSKILDETLQLSPQAGSWGRLNNSVSPED